VGAWQCWPKARLRLRNNDLAVIWECMGVKNGQSWAQRIIKIYEGREMAFSLLKVTLEREREDDQGKTLNTDKDEQQTGGITTNKPNLHFVESNWGRRAITRRYYCICRERLVCQSKVGRKISEGG